MLADIFVLLVDVKAPEELYQVLRDNELITLPKKDYDIRPVGMGLVIRKLVSILFLSHTFEKPAVVEDSARKLVESFNDLHFKGLQYGCTERGTEKIITSHGSLWSSILIAITSSWTQRMHSIKCRVGKLGSRSTSPSSFPF